jgi:hypothetical protein
MDGYDLDHPLALDCCDGCGAIDWKDCVCYPTTRSRVQRALTAAELELGREERLALAERGRGAAGGQ